MNWKSIFAVMSVAIYCTSASSATDKGSLALVFEDKSHADFFPQNKFIVGSSGVRYYYLENGRKKMYSEISIKDSKLIYTTCELRPKQNPKCEPGVEGGSFPVKPKSLARFNFMGVETESNDKKKTGFEVQIQRCLSDEEGTCNPVGRDPKIRDKEIIIKFVPEGRGYRAMVIKRLETWIPNPSPCRDTDITNETIFDIQKGVLPLNKGNRNRVKWEKNAKTILIGSADFPAGIKALSETPESEIVTPANTAGVKHDCAKSDPPQERQGESPAPAR